MLRLAGGLRQLGVPLAEVAPILEVVHDGVCGDIRGRLTKTLTSVLVEVDAQMDVLRGVREHVASILGGLRTMKPTDATVPGVEACPCVEMVAAP